MIGVTTALGLHHLSTLRDASGPRHEPYRVWEGQYLSRVCLEKSRKLESAAGSGNALGTLYAATNPWHMLKLCGTSPFRTGDAWECGPNQRSAGRHHLARVKGRAGGPSTRFVSSVVLVEQTYPATAGMGSGRCDVG